MTAEFRLIAAGEFAAVSPTSEDVGAAPMLQWIKICDLVVDETYQRPIYGAGRINVRRIAENFRWSRFAPIVVSPVAGGKFAIIDGQHRTTAAALRGIESVPAQVIICEQREQAEAFAAINGQVTRMNSLCLHAAAVASGDEEALKVQATAEAAGVVILKHPRTVNRMKPGETVAFGAIREGLKAYGPEAVITALQCVTETKNNVPGALGSCVIKALCAVLAANQAWRDGGGAPARRLRRDRRAGRAGRGAGHAPPQGDRHLGGARRSAARAAPRADGGVRA